MIVRELLSIFGLQYDGSGQQQAEKGLDQLKSQVDTIATAFADIFKAAAIASPFVLLAKMASDADENLNLLQVAFGESAQSVVEWSNEVGPAIGRSKFSMRELAAEFGGLLRPMVGTGEQLTEMSKQLSVLAVDLSSIRNISEKDALRAFQGALSGSTETMKRFGVNLNQARLDQEALNAGLGKSAKDLTQAQKATLIYNVMMKDLAFIQGDAAKTQFGFANSTRALRDQLKDIGTEFGLFLLPAFEDLLRTVRILLTPVADLALQFKEWAANTNLARGALLAVGLVVGSLVLPALWSLLTVLGPLILAGVVFAFIMDDVITTFEGGDSIINRVTTALDTLEKEGFPGVGTAAEVAITIFNRFRDLLGAVGFAVFSLFKALLSGDWKIFERNIMALNASFETWLTSLGKWGKGLRLFFNALISPITAVAGLLLGMNESILSGNLAPLKGALAGVKGLGADLVGNTKELIGKNPFSKGRITPPALAQGGIGGPGADAAGLARRTVTINSGGNSFTFNVTQEPGESSEDFAQRVRTLIDENNTDQAADTFANLVQDTP
jgi:hypothetical protein